MSFFRKIWKNKAPELESATVSSPEPEMSPIVMMDNNGFKGAFNQVARKYGFEKAYGGWFKDSEECIAVLDLQRSNFSNLYYLNIKIFVQGMFGETYRRNKDLVKRDIGNIFERPPWKYHDIFDLETSMADETRIERLDDCFEHYIGPMIEKGATMEGIQALGEEGRIRIEPAVDEQLKILMGERAT